MKIIVLSSHIEIDVVIESVKKYNCCCIQKVDNAFEGIEDILKEIKKN